MKSGWKLENGPHTQRMPQTQPGGWSLPYWDRAIKDLNEDVNDEHKDSEKYAQLAKDLERLGLKEQADQVRDISNQESVHGRTLYLIRLATIAKRDEELERQGKR
jgi:hypothetical protein